MWRVLSSIYGKLVSRTNLDFKFKLYATRLGRESRELEAGDLAYLKLDLRLESSRDRHRHSHW